MISPRTKPGTKVVAVKRCPRPEMPAGDDDLPFLRLGSQYTVDHIEDGFGPGDQFRYGVFLVEFLREHGAHPIYDLAYSLDCFRYLDLPESITSCLNVTSLDAPAELERA
jgi:hypothetical protein